MYRPKVAIEHFRSVGRAECETCQTDKEWTRERARTHAAESVHTVRFVIEDTTVYTPLEKTHG